MKNQEKINLLKRIVNYCKKNKISGSYNNTFEGYRISFNIEELNNKNKR